MDFLECLYFYSSRRRCLVTPRMFLFPSSSPSPPSPSPSVRSARSLQKGHLVQKCFVFICVSVCVCAIGKAYFDGVGLGM